MDEIRNTSKLIQLLFEKIGVKFNPYKINKYVDIGFIIIEKVIVNLDKLHFIYFDFYRDLVKNEISLAGINKDMKILHIGCGPIPATSILITKYTDAKITCIDKNQKSINKASICISKHNLSEKIQVLFTDAEFYPVENFDIIIVSQGVKPIKKILNYISTSMEDGSYVIFRTSSSPSGDISKKDLFIKNIFKLKKLISHKKNALLISILLLKK